MDTEADGSGETVLADLVCQCISGAWPGISLNSLQ
jgi:hypothetical protein